MISDKMTESESKAREDMIKVCVLSVVCNVHTTDIYTDIYDTPVVFVTMIQILDEKLTVSYSKPAWLVSAQLGWRRWLGTCHQFYYI